MSAVSKLLSIFKKHPYLAALLIVALTIIIIMSPQILDGFKKNVTVINKLKSENTDLTNTNIELGKEINRLRKEINNLEKGNTDLTNTNIELKSENTDLTNTNIELGKEINRLRKEINNLEKENTDLTNTNIELGKENQRLGNEGPWGKESMEMTVSVVQYSNKKTILKEGELLSCPDIERGQTLQIKSSHMKDNQLIEGETLELKVANLIYSAKDCRKRISYDLKMSCPDATKIFTEKILTCGEDNEVKWVHPRENLSVVAVFRDNTAHK